MCAFVLYVPCAIKVHVSISHYESVIYSRILLNASIFTRQTKHKNDLNTSSRVFKCSKVFQKVPEDSRMF